jgi:hypothetical protein
MPVEVQGFVALEATHVERLAQVGDLVRLGHLHSRPEIGKSARQVSVSISCNYNPDAGRRGMRCRRGLRGPFYRDARRLLQYPSGRLLMPLPCCEPFQRFGNKGPR